MSQDPLFILAPPRSFTSVVCGMIGQHPELYGLPEVNLFAADSYADLGETLYKMRPGFRHGLLRTISELGLGEQTDVNIEVAKDWLEEHEAVDSGELYKDLVEWVGDRRLIDKSPIYVYSDDNLQRIAKAFPNARYIHLARHPRPTCESIYSLREVVREGIENMRGGEKIRERARQRQEKLASIEDPESLWLEPHTRIQAFLQDIPQDRWKFIRGEEFMTHPDKYLAIIAKWLGVSQSTEALEAMKHPEQSPFASLGPPRAKYGNDPSFLESPALREYKPKDYSLDGELDGGEPGRYLSDKVKECANKFGYH
ncbi:MAG TPA: sulfotransferase [Chromatiaceae bacterium]|jgi:hypothetical protein|nr:sulfotransferase [Chromatiaceae bacterium]HIN81467.1 sulfotransferase [Chromatiales bacterium]